MKLILALVLVSMTAGRAQAYSHSFVNKLKSPVRFWVNYVACSNDTWETVKPGQTITWRSGLCCIKNTNVGDASGKSIRKDRPDIPMNMGSVETGIFDSISLPWSLADAAQCHNTNWGLVSADGRVRIVKY
jgi:hypothetical protein